MQMNLFDENGMLPSSNTSNAGNCKQIKYIKVSRNPLPPYRKNAPKGTSKVAATRITRYARNQRMRVFDAIENAGTWGLTDEEGQALTGIKTQSYTPRRGELAQAGQIRDTGERRKTVSGCPAAVWVAVSKREESGDA